MEVAAAAVPASFAVDSASTAGAGGFGAGVTFATMFSRGAGAGRCGLLSVPAASSGTPGRGWRGSLPVPLGEPATFTSFADTCTGEGPGAFLVGRDAGAEAAFFRSVLGVGAVGGAAGRDFATRVSAFAGLRGVSVDGDGVGGFSVLVIGGGDGAGVRLEATVTGFCVVASASVLLVFVDVVEGAAAAII